MLAIDIGNTRLKWAVYARGLPGEVALEQGAVFLENIENLSEGEWRGLSPPRRVVACNVASDAVRHRVQEQLELWDIEPRWVVSSAGAAGVTNGYDHPGRLGVDRFVSLVGARWHMLQRGPIRPVLVVMIGTAVTVDALDSSGRFLGGLILPGHGIMLRALEGGTAGLRVPTGEVVRFPTNTSDALTSGGTYAITGAIEHQFHELQAHSGGVAPLVLVTGGAGWKVAPYLRVPHELLDSLIFDGLLAIDCERERSRT
ncbi:MAG: type III pantothenate kinase [Rubrivivax sp.]|nr:type III pantothenate kinase [Rubrivivax sp.]